MELMDAGSRSSDCLNTDLKARYDDGDSSIDSIGKPMTAALGLSKNGWRLTIPVPRRDNPNLYPLRGGNAEGVMARLKAARDRAAQITGKRRRSLSSRY